MVILIKSPFFCQTLHNIRFNTEFFLHCITLFPPFLVLHLIHSVKKLQIKFISHLLLHVHMFSLTQQTQK